MVKANSQENDDGELMKEIEESLSNIYLEGNLQIPSNNGKRKRDKFLINTQVNPTLKPKLKKKDLYSFFGN